MAGVVLAMAVSASADAITYNTMSTGAAGTGFVGDPNPNELILNSTGGTQAATLTFTGDTNVATGTPSGISYGHFVLACPGCTTQAVGTGYSIFPDFTFDLVVTDVTDGATGVFAGTAVIDSGDVFSDVSPITIDWVPLTLGPGTSNATAGSFGQTEFDTTNPTEIVAPNNGDIAGRTSVQGEIDSVPEPATFSLIGGALMGLGLLGRKRLFRA
jgi:hypothetical protein